MNSLNSFSELPTEVTDLIVSQDEGEAPSFPDQEEAASSHYQQPASSPPADAAV
jgi:hypothetical protein